ncbi:MAG TPA: sigma-70 family RNA polymerase sigma factor [Tepidisphaeraceae bacterium]|nr:sigma-70 family RNA polymerase sigma factor [Tepidisphaeraceae bacterium]
MDHAIENSGRGARGEALPDYATRASIFAKLNSPEPVDRETAWKEFFARYGPVIVAFAKRCGAGRQDINDIVQDVMASFFAVSGEFEYDPKLGRFRGWLKTCTVRAAVRRAGKNLRFQGVPLDERTDVQAAAEPIWQDVWERELFARALTVLRQTAGDGVPFRAFEQYVLLDRPAQDVAQELNTSVDNVHQAKSRMTTRLREIVRRLRSEDE